MDGTGNANIVLPITTNVRGDKDFTVSLQRNATSTSNVAVSTPYYIYDVVSPTITGGNVVQTFTTQLGVSDIFIKSKLHKFRANGNLVVSSFGTSKNLSYAKVFGGTGTKAYFAGNNSVIKSTLIGAGSSGDVTGISLKGGSAGQVSNLKIAFSELSSGNNPIIIGSGGNSAVTIDGVLGAGGNTTFLTYIARGGNISGSGNGFTPGSDNNQPSYSVGGGGGGAGALENGSDAGVLFDPTGTPHIPGGDGGAGPVFANSLTVANYTRRGFPGNVEQPQYYIANVANTTVFQDNPTLDMDTPSTGLGCTPPMFDIVVASGGGGGGEGLDTLTQANSRTVPLSAPTSGTAYTGGGSGGAGKVNNTGRGGANAGWPDPAYDAGRPGGGGGGGPNGGPDIQFICDNYYGVESFGTWPGQGGPGEVWIRYPYVATPFRYIIDQEF
jgi:hypothetical protein